LVVSQQMLQFVPDRAAALREIRRVLVPGGRFIAATWRARHELPLFETLGSIAERHLGTPNEKRFALGEEALLSTLLAEAGFAEVRVETVTRTEHYTQFPYRLSALAANFDLSALSDAEREARLTTIETESVEAMKHFAVDGGFAAPSRANLVTAIVK
jgi:SAM-dependent methyltransferase